MSLFIMGFLGTFFFSFLLLLIYTWKETKRQGYSSCEPVTVRCPCELSPREILCSRTQSLLPPYLPLALLLPEQLTSHLFPLLSYSSRLEKKTQKPFDLQASNFVLRSNKSRSTLLTSRPY
jgi:hypothetical protein